MRLAFTKLIGTWIALVHGTKSMENISGPKFGTSWSRFIWTLNRR